jgi:hypothetical protein
VLLYYLARKGEAALFHKHAGLALTASRHGSLETAC